MAGSAESGRFRPEDLGGDSTGQSKELGWEADRSKVCWFYYLSRLKKERPNREDTGELKLYLSETSGRQGRS